MNAPPPPLLVSQVEHDRLNNALRADPALLLNMLEMGFIRSGPFHDHNGVLVPEYFLTQYGLEEMAKRDHDRVVFHAQEAARKTGQDR